MYGLGEIQRMNQEAMSEPHVGDSCECCGDMTYAALLNLVGRDPAVDYDASLRFCDDCYVSYCDRHLGACGKMGE